jgi:small subunit ribosomal protein S1
VATSSTSKNASTMADLLKSVAQTSFVSLHKGQVIDGVITKLTAKEILIDIGAKTEAVVLEKDHRLLRNLLNSLKVGDKVAVYVLNPESDLGNPVVSLRKFTDDKLWDKLAGLQKNKTIVKITVNESTKGGFLVSGAEGFSGFLPNSQISYAKTGQDLIGKEIDAMILELSRQGQKIILSSKAIGGSDNFDEEIKSLKIEQKISTIISNITPFGIFTLIKADGGNIEGFIHISEVSWEKILQIPQDFKAGDVLEAMIIGFDKKTSRVNLSLKRLVSDPFEEKLGQFVPEKKVSATISKVLAIGLLVDLGDGIEGIIKKEKIPPTVKYEVGQALDVTVLEVDKKKHRVSLSPVLKEKPIGYR